MLVSHTNRFIFIKTGKTAGTSVEIYFEPLCAEEGHEPVHGTEALVSVHGIIGERRPPAKRTEGERFQSHIRAVNLKALLDPEVWDGYFKFATVRHPFDRAVSAFHHFDLPKSEAETMTRDEIVGRFRKWALGQKPRAFSLLHWLMIDGEYAMDFVIRYENLERDVEQVRRLVDPENRIERSLPRFKTETRVQGIELKEYFDPDIIAHIAEGCEREFSLFSYDIAVFR